MMKFFERLLCSAEICVGDSGYVAGILYQSMLKAASVATKGRFAGTRELDTGSMPSMLRYGLPGEPQRPSYRK